jgi:hypothetical protein
VNRPSSSLILSVGLTLGLLSPLVLDIATTEADEASTIIERCLHGQSLAGFSPSAYAAALQELTPTIKEYSDCEELISKAELAAPTSTNLATPTPLLGKTATVKAISGTVKVRLKGTHKFVALSALTSLPDGSEVDATHGTVLITAATSPGATESAEADGGSFVIEQEQKAPAETHLELSLPLTGCPKVTLPHGSAATASKAKHRSGPTSRHLWVSEGGGNWSTSGRYVSTTVEGTRWLTLDECNRSEVEVAAGKVKVHDLIHNTTKILTAGKTYIAAR